MSEATKRVKRVPSPRGAALVLAPHPRTCASDSELKGLVDDLRAEDPGRLLAADLFCGAGGLSLGLHNAGLEVVFAVDHDQEAVATHGHHFPGMTVDWDLSDPAVVHSTGRLLESIKVDVIVGGPPCQPFSKAGRSKIRHAIRQGLRDPHDQRRDLWQSYLDIIREARPRAVVMENVPDMALDREMFILRSMVYELESMGYSVEERLFDTWRYGVPQFRQRLILVALRDRIKFSWPAEQSRKVTVMTAIGDLPAVESGWRPAGMIDGALPYAGPNTRFQKQMRQGVAPECEEVVYDHFTRSVRPDDAVAFSLMDSSTKYSDLPDEVKRYRDDIFDDKYKRLDAEDLSRTITAHIAKDGYWYIHPTQDRTITVREAARLQTFPDWFRFSGTPPAAFRQIGNAVPPLAGQALGGALISSLASGESEGLSSEERSMLLAGWWDSADAIQMPWLKAKTRWQVIAGEMVLDRATARQVTSCWPMLNRHLTAASTLSDAESLLRLGAHLRRSAKVERLLALAEHVNETNLQLDDADLEALVAARLISPGTADVAALVVGHGADDSSEEPVVVAKGVMRVAARVAGSDADRRNKSTHGRLSIAGLVGFGSNSRRAHVALIAIANTFCRPSAPDCRSCPLLQTCAESDHFLRESRASTPLGMSPLA